MMEVSYRLRIPLVDADETSTRSNGDDSSSSEIPESLIDAFRNDGFVIIRDVCSQEGVNNLNDHLEDVLRGVYDRGTKPDKVPRLLKSAKPEQIFSSTTGTADDENDGDETSIKKKKKKSSVGPIGFSGNLQNVRVLQIINIHKADSLFRKLETNNQLGNLVAQLAGWEHGARLAQDQVWAKPPGAPPLVFHRDSPYFMFEPADVVTVWFALDDMDPELGPLEYVRGSHLWGDGRVGSANQFFQSNVKSLLKSAAEREGLDVHTLDIVSMAGLKAGGMSIHNGKIWHGSGKNDSKNRPRRGLGLHFVPANVRFTTEASKSSLWKSYVIDAEDPSKVELPEEDFPTTSSFI